MYLLLCAGVVAHQLYSTMHTKTDRWPLRAIYLRLLELLGRCLMLPIVFFLFTDTVIPDQKKVGRNIVLIAVSISVVIFSREYFGVKSVFFEAVQKLLEKINAPGLSIKELSSIEAIVVNLWVFKTFSWSKIPISDHLINKGPITADVYSPVHLKHAATLRSLFGRSLRVSATNLDNHQHSQSFAASDVEMQTFHQILDLSNTENLMDSMERHTELGMPAVRESRSGSLCSSIDIA
jgi:hypothetical protein